jgi:hypothetical protein
VKRDKEDFAPGTLVDHGDCRYSLTYASFPPFDDLCTAEGMQDRGTFWQSMVIHLLEEDDGPEALEALDFESEPTSFAAISDDLEALHAVAKALRKLEHRNVVAELVDKIDLRQYG